MLIFAEAFAQFPPRKDDHFWRRKIVNRIDLNEKMNAPLIKRESGYYTDNSQYTEKDGLIMTLFNGLKSGKYVAYHPDSLTKSLSYEDVRRRIKEFEGSLEGESDFDDFGSDFGDGAGGEGGLEGGFDDFEGGFDGGADEWGFGEDEDLGGGLDDLGGGEPAVIGGSMSGSDFDPAPFENVIQFVEDRIFDKTRSDMVYDIQFVEIIWTDPGETLPEKKLCTFAYTDILETLEKAQWKNRFNDAEYKTMREVFELRLFHSFIIEVSGEGLNSLQVAEYRRQKLVEFEHHLWSY